MDGKKTLKNIIIVALGNVMTLLSGIMLGFFLPKILGVTDYGYYKTFTLYITYVGLFHFGFSDGVYLLYAGKKYDDLDRGDFRLFFKTLFFTQCFLLVIFTSVALILTGTSKTYSFIILFVGINCLLSNLVWYFQFISQVTMRFKEYSIVNSVRAFANIAAVTALYIMYKSGVYEVLPYRVYVYVFTAINLLSAAWYLITYRAICFGKSASFAEKKREIINIYKVGAVLMISNFVASLVLTIDRQFVQILFSTDVYSVYAFAYNMLTLLTTTISSVATVMYPIIKTAKEDELISRYGEFSAIMLCVAALGLIAFFPLTLIVNHWLDKFSGALEIFRVILPGLVLTTQISVVMLNYYKSFGLIKSYFWRVLAVFAFAVGSNTVAYLIFRTPVSISVASIVTVLVWYFVAQLFLSRKVPVKWLKNFIFAALVMALFYGATALPWLWAQFAAFAAAAVALIVIFYGKTLAAFLGSALKRNTGGKREEKNDDKALSEGNDETKPENL